MSVSVCLFLCCLSVCPRAATRPIYSDIFVNVVLRCMTWLEVVLWRRCDTLCTSGFLDNVIFAHGAPHIFACR